MSKSQQSYRKGQGTKSDERKLVNREERKAVKYILNNVEDFDEDVDELDLIERDKLSRKQWVE